MVRAVHGRGWNQERGKFADAQPALISPGGKRWFFPAAGYEKACGETGYFNGMVKSEVENPDYPLKMDFMKPFEEIIEFIAETAGEEKLSAFKPSAAAEKRVIELLAKQEAGSLRPKEWEELQLFVQLDHVMSLAKARSRNRRRVPAA